MGPRRKYICFVSTNVPFDFHRSTPFTWKWRTPLQWNDESPTVERCCWHGDKERRRIQQAVQLAQNQINTGDFFSNVYLFLITSPLSGIDYFIALIRPLHQLRWFLGGVHLLEQKQPMQLHLLIKMSLWWRWIAEFMVRKYRFWSREILFPRFSPSRMWGSHEIEKLRICLLWVAVYVTSNFINFSILMRFLSTNLFGMLVKVDGFNIYTLL